MFIVQMSVLKMVSERVGVQLVMGDRRRLKGV